MVSLFMMFSDGRARTIWSEMASWENTTNMKFDLWWSVIDTKVMRI